LSGLGIVIYCCVINAMCVKEYLFKSLDDSVSFLYRYIDFSKDQFHQHQLTSTLV